MTTWRWDQGRRDYFHFEHIRETAFVLAAHDGASLSSDFLRSPLEAATALAFPPPHYTVWRNFGRVFKTCLLAVDDEGRLHVTEVCRALASRTLGREDYLALLMRRLYMPWPAFSGLLPADERDLVFPAAAVVKLLLSRHDAGLDAAATLEEVSALLIGNGVTGREPVDNYLALTPTPLTLDGDEKRQVREMLQFFSQASVLSWDENQIQLRLSRGDEDARAYVEFLADPEVGTPLADRDDELLRLGRIGIYGSLPHQSPIAQVELGEAARVRTRRELRLADRDRGDRLVIGDYVPAAEGVQSAPRVPYAVDLDAIDRGNSAHRRTQNLMSAWARGRGFEVGSVRVGPSPDLMFRTAEGWCVVEVKSLTDANEVQQIRLGIGQVLDYCFDLRVGLAESVRPVLALERAPSNPKWVELCAHLGIWLTWAPEFSGDGP